MCVEEPGGDLSKEARSPSSRGPESGRGVGGDVGGEVEEGEQPGQGQAAVRRRLGRGAFNCDEDSFRKYCFSCKSVLN